ncbi:MAG: FHA domain-containing protein [Planctomycetota bacterium]
MSIDVTITHLTGSKQNQVETVRGLPVKLGRSDECKVRFDPEADSRVSAEHAELRETDDGGVEVVDLDSKNGLTLNGVKVEGSARVSNRSTLEVGVGGPRVRLEFEQGGGVDFGRVRRDTARRLDKDKIESRKALVSTDEGFPAYDLAELEGKSPGKAAPPLPLPLIAGVAMIVIGLLGVLIYALIG